MLESQLKNLGLTEKEITVYLEVLKNGRVSPTEVARASKINRTTVYSVAKELVKKVLFWKIWQDKRVRWSPWRRRT